MTDENNIHKPGRIDIYFQEQKEYLQMLTRSELVNLCLRYQIENFFQLEELLETRTELFMYCDLRLGEDDPAIKSEDE